MFILAFLVVATVIAFLFRDAILGFLLEPGFGRLGQRPIATEVLETVSTTFKVVLMAGFVATLPMVLYHIIMFITPGLTVHERLYVFLLLPAALISFVGGAAFGYYQLFPRAFEFLFEFGSENVDSAIRISSYISVLVSLMFWMGMVFQIPLLMFALARMGLVTPSMLTRFRRFAIVLAFVAAAIITPTFDPLNQTLVAVPILVLYEIGILLARIGRRLGREPKLDSEGDSSSRLRKVKFWHWFRSGDGE
jgi:sec-independent protein translocase protein TatC